MRDFSVKGFYSENAVGKCDLARFGLKSEHNSNFCRGFQRIWRFGLKRTLKNKLKHKFLILNLKNSILKRSKTIFPSRFGKFNQIELRKSNSKPKKLILSQNATFDSKPVFDSQIKRRVGWFLRNSS